MAETILPHRRTYPQGATSEHLRTLAVWDAMNNTCHVCHAHRDTLRAYQLGVHEVGTARLPECADCTRKLSPIRDEHEREATA